MIEVKKAWGKEVWITNNDKYCGKLLYVDKGAESSLHRHPGKQETFLCIKGRVALTVEDTQYKMKNLSEPVTIYPGQLHSFRGVTDSIILEVSTPHWDEDVERLTESKQGLKELEK